MNAAPDSLRMPFDVAVVGAGIVGLATARQLLVERPALRVVVIDKEARVAAHQTGRNSGVMHSGVYYRPGSLKARLCRRGLRLLEAYCDDRGVRRERCGKVIVATELAEVARLDDIEARGRDNGVALRRLDPAGLREVEPYASGVAALHVPETGIVDYGRVCDALASDVEARGGVLVLGAEVGGIAVGDPIRVRLATRDIEVGALVNCAGLYSDRVAKMAGADLGVRIVPFRGEYYRLRPQAERLCRGLIYPVPDPSFPSLGVHLTRLVGGGVECGPNAVFALSREGYTWGDVDAGDVADALAWPGFRRLARRYWRTGLAEMARSRSRVAFARSVSRLVPAVEPAQLVAAPSGVRAQAVRRDGALVDDFVFERVGNTLHVVNAPSPAATAALAIAEHVVAQIPDLVR